MQKLNEAIYIKHLALCLEFCKHLHMLDIIITIIIITATILYSSNQGENKQSFCQLNRRGFTDLGIKTFNPAQFDKSPKWLSY